MKFSFKKISAIATSALMLGMTMGVAAAANYPTPFLDSPAIVYGTGAGVSTLDQVYATNINLDLTARGGTSSGGAVGSVSGEAMLFETGTNKLNIGNNLTDIKTVAIDGDDLPTVLADGTYSNAENTDFDYEQKIDLSVVNLQYAHWADSNYNSKAPTLGIQINKNEHILNYTLDFVKSAEDDTASGDDFLDFEDTTIQILGKTYDIVDATNTSASTKLTLMAGIEKGVLSYQESGSYTTADGTYEIIVTYVDDDECKFSVDGVSTDKLQKGQVDKLADGTFIGVTEVDYSVGATTEIMTCEFYVGANKLILEDTKEVEIDEVDVDELKVYFDQTQGNPFKLNKIILEWKAEEDMFVTEDSEITMPGFGSVKLTSTGLVAPTGEEIKVRGSSTEDVELTVTLKSGTTTIQLLGSNETGGFDAIGGADDNEGLLTSNLIDGTGAAVANLIYNTTGEADGHQYFVATYYSGADGSSYLVEISDSDDTDGVDFKDVISGSNLATNIKNATSFTIGDSVFTLNSFIEDEWVNFTAGSNTYVDRLVTEAGLTIYLPVGNSSSEVACISPLINLNVSDADHATSYIIYMDEEDKDGTLNNGDDINVTVSHVATTHEIEATISTVSDNIFSGGADFEDPDDDNMYIGYAESDLGTKVMYDADPDEDTVDILYYGEQIYGEVFIAEAGAVATAGTAGTGTVAQIGNVVYKDSETTSYADKNVIIVGGSCINSAAAKVLGLTANTCGAEWTTATGVGAGQYLIQGFASSTVTSKHAMLVAGYEVAETQMATEFLTHQTVDTSKKYIGESKILAELQVEEVTTE